MNTPPDWLQGSFTDVVYDADASPRTVEVQTRESTLQLNDAPHGCSVTVTFTAHGHVSVRGSVGPNSAIYIKAPNSSNLRVASSFARVDVLEAAQGNRQLRLPQSLAVLHLPDGSWATRKNQDGAKPVDVTVVGGDCELSGELLPRSVNVPDGQADLNLPLEMAEHIETDGALTLRQPVSKSTTVLAPSIEVTSPVTAGQFRARQVTFRGGATGSPQTPVLVQLTGESSDAPETSLTVEGSARHLGVLTQGSVDISGGVKHSIIVAATVKVHGNLECSKVVATGGGNAVQVGKVTVPGPQLHHQNVETDKATGWSEHFSSVSDGGSVSESTVIAAHPDSEVDIGAAERSALLAAGSLEVAGKLSTPTRLETRQARVRELVLDSEEEFRAAFHHLMVETLRLEGTLEVQRSLRVWDVLEPDGAGDHPRITAPVVQIGHHAQGAHLTVTEQVVATLDNASEVHLTSTAKKLTTTGGHFPYAHLEHAPNGEARWELGSRVGTLTVDGPTSLDLQPNARIGWANVNDDLSITGWEGETYAQIPLKLKRSFTFLRLTHTHDTAVVVAAVSPDVTVALSNQSKTLRLRLDAEDEPRPRLSFLGLKEPLPLNLETEDLPPGMAPELNLFGAVDCTLQGRVSALHATPSVEAAPSGFDLPDDAASASGMPTLSLIGQESAAHDATGELRLGTQFDGTLYGHREGVRARIWKAVVRKPRVQLSVMDTRPRDRASNGADDGDVGVSGRLIDVDIAELHLNQLDRLDDFEVIEPTPYSLRDFGKRKPGDEMDADSERAQYRVFAERAARVSKLLDGSAASGGARTSARWAEARLHHRSLPPGGERFLRRFNRALGYGQNPRWAFATLALSYLTVVAVRLGCWKTPGIRGFCLGTPQADEPFATRLAAAMSNTLLQPFTLIQFTTNPDPLFHRGVVNLAVFLVLGIPFLFFIIALKNYLTLRDD